MFEDISNAIKATLYERVSSPFISSFILSWCIFNYKILFILFSNMEVRYKFYEIEVLQQQPQVLMGIDLPIYPFTFIYPFLAAIFYTLMFPFIEVWLTHVWMIGQKKIKSKKIQFEDETPISQEQYAALLKKLRQMDRDYQEDLERKDNECGIQLKIASSMAKQREDELEKLKKSYYDLEIEKYELDERKKGLENHIEKTVNDNKVTAAEVSSLVNDLKVEIKKQLEENAMLKSENYKNIEQEKNLTVKLEKYIDAAKNEEFRSELVRRKEKENNMEIKSLNNKIESLHHLISIALNRSDIPNDVRNILSSYNESQNRFDGTPI